MWNLEPFCWFLHQAYNYIHLVLWVFSAFVTWQGIQSTVSPCIHESSRQRLCCLDAQVLERWNATHCCLEWVQSFNPLCLQDMTRSEMMVQDDYWCVQRFGVETDQENTIDWLHPKQSAWLVWNVWLIFKFSVPCTFFLGSWFCFCWEVQPAKHQRSSIWSIKWSSNLKIEFIQPCWAKKFRKNPIFKFVPARMLTVTLISWRSYIILSVTRVVCRPHNLGLYWLCRGNTCRISTNT